MPSLRCVNELTHPSCDLCGATVPRNLTHFHQLWHENQIGQPTPFFGDQDTDPEVTRLLQMVAALRAVPPVTARTKFVMDLRARLLAETLNRASGRLGRGESLRERVGDWSLVFRLLCTGAVVPRRGTFVVCLRVPSCAWPRPPLSTRCPTSTTRTWSWLTTTRGRGVSEFECPAFGTAWSDRPGC